MTRRPLFSDSGAGITPTQIERDALLRKGGSMPRKAYLALTDRRLLVIARGLFGGDRDASHPIALNRIQDATIRSAIGRAVARIGLRAGNDLAIEVPSHSASELAAFIEQVQAMIARQEAGPHSRREWPFG